MKKKSFLIIPVFLFFVASASAGGLFFHKKPNQVPLSKVESKQPSKCKSAQIDLNTASRNELSKVKRLGKRRANQIILYREKNGPFTNLEELKKIKGFSEKLVIALKKRLVIKGDQKN